MKTNTPEKPTVKNPLCECDNCGHRALHDSLPPAKDIEERCADPDDEYSDVECPECGALCFEVPPSSLVRAVARLKICGGSGGYAADNAVKMALSRALNGGGSAEDQIGLVRELVRALENALAYVPMAASGSSLETHPVRIEAKRVIAKANAK